MKTCNKCPTCGRQYIDPKRVQNALRLIAAGVGLSAAARAALISRQRLHQILKAKGLVAKEAPHV